MDHTVKKESERSPPPPFGGMTTVRCGLNAGRARPHVQPGCGSRGPACRVIAAVASRTVCTRPPACRSVPQAFEDWNEIRSSHRPSRCRTRGRGAVRLDGAARSRLVQRLKDGGDVGKRQQSPIPLHQAGAGSAMRAKRVCSAKASPSAATDSIFESRPCSDRSQGYCRCCSRHWLLRGACDCAGISGQFAGTAAMAGRVPPAPMMQALIALLVGIGRGAISACGAELSGDRTNCAEPSGPDYWPFANLIFARRSRARRCQSERCTSRVSPPDRIPGIARP